MSPVIEPKEINIKGLSDQTRRAVWEWAVTSLERDAWADRIWWEFDDFAALYWRLRLAPDMPEIFPKGKWATLQRMEEMLAQSWR